MRDSGICDTSGGLSVPGVEVFHTRLWISAHRAHRMNAGSGSYRSGLQLRPTPLTSRSAASVWWAEHRMIEFISRAQTRIHARKLDRSCHGATHHDQT